MFVVTWLNYHIRTVRGRNGEKEIETYHRQRELQQHEKRDRREDFVRGERGVGSQGRCRERAESDKYYERLVSTYRVTRDTLNLQGIPDHSAMLSD